MTDDLPKDCGVELAAIAEHISRLQARVDELEKREERQRSELFRRMWESAMAGDKTMLIWLSKQVLDFRDAPAPPVRNAG